MQTRLKSLVLFLSLLVAAVAGDIRVATLNCYLFFDPAIDHPGQVDDNNPLTRETYVRKVENLAQLASKYDVVGLQETGGRKEISDLAAALGFDWGYAKGRDTYTGQEVGFVYRRLPGWKFTVNGRVADLDRVLSKHLLMTAVKDGVRVRFLTVHMIRPIGQNADKHRAQTQAINAWAEAEMRTPSTIVVVLGDMNYGERSPLFNFGSEVNQANGYAATHLSGRAFDRMTASAPAKWSEIEIVAPPYGRRPNDHLKQIWTDHYLVGARLRF